MKSQLAAESNQEHNQFIEIGTHSFVVKIGLEQAEPHETPDRWRGEITHVASGKRARIQHWGDLLAFLQPYLEALQIKLPLLWRLYLWMNR